MNHQQTKKANKKSKSNPSNQNDEHQNPASDETLVNSSDEEDSGIDDIDSEEEEDSDDDSEVGLDNPNNGRYMRVMDADTGETDYMRHPDCRLTLAGAKEFGIPYWLWYLYE